MSHRQHARRHMLCGLIAAVSVSSTAAVFAADPVYHRSERTAERGWPFSDAVQLGEIVFLSGQIGTRPDGGGLIEGGIGPESRQTMENVRSAVLAAGSTMDRVVKCTVFLADMADWPAFNTVYREFFPENALPARSALGVNGLALGARVEVECIAAAGTGSSPPD